MEAWARIQIGWLHYGVCGGENSPHIGELFAYPLQLCLIPFTILGVFAAHYGFGRNIWDIKPNNIIKAIKVWLGGIFYEEQTNSTQVFFWDELLYTTILSLCKVSMLMFYLRIFPSQNFRRICFLILGWVLTTMILFQLLTVFQCLPTSYNWNGWMGTYKNFKCLDLNSLTYSAASVNIAQDFAILILPLPWLVKLKISWKKKINVLLIFSMGTLYVAIWTLW